MNEQPEKVGKRLWFSPLKRRIGYSLKNIFLRSYSQTEEDIAGYVNNSPHKWLFFIGALVIVIVLNLLLIF